LADIANDLSPKSENEKAAHLKELAECDVTGAALEQLTTAASKDELLVALERRVSRYTPLPLRAGSLYLQPTEERRRSGSHYTPRTLTEPIVRTTLQPLLQDLGQDPKPEQILNLKVCDPSMGSGAFLVETCRLLADQLVTAWVTHKSLPKLPPNEEPVVLARRLVAQQCLYGVDKNPFAVDLAKLSLRPARSV
jgi:type I restriction-modification system DNA methylase subunit